MNRVYLRVFADNLGAIKSYEKAGFRQISGEFMVDGIPHIGMVRDSTVNAK